MAFITLLTIASTSIILGKEKWGKSRKIPFINVFITILSIVILFVTTIMFSGAEVVVKETYDYIPSEHVVIHRTVEIDGKVYRANYEFKEEEPYIEIIEYKTEWWQKILFFSFIYDLQPERAIIYINQ